MRFLITTLAEYQTTFWRKVGIQLRELGHDIAFISFDDRSSEMLEIQGLRVFRATAVDGMPSLTDPECDALFARFRIDCVNYWLAHERFGFHRHDSSMLRRKLACALIAVDRACEEWAKDGPSILVQELGGFLSVIASFFVARAHGWDNWFIEPSFFRGRLFFVRNSFNAITILQQSSVREISFEVKNYLDETLKSGAIVIPQKDRHQYTTARKKILNFRNLNRLIEKVADKHVLGKKQEFDGISSHVTNHVRMLFNSYRLISFYTNINKIKRFFYYPLHVPGDMALTLRSPQYLDQLGLIDFICRSVPSNHILAIKEHPAMIGAVESGRLIGLLNRFDNLVLLHPTMNNFDVIRRSEAVISVNSKSGAEAGLLGKPVLVLGDAFYKEAPFTTVIDRLQDLPHKLADSILPDRVKTSDLSVRRYFADVWDLTVAGELYVNDVENIRVFSRSMIQAVSRRSN